MEAFLSMLVTLGGGLVAGYLGALMMWQKRVPEVAERHEISAGPVTLAISEASSRNYGTYWQHVCVSLGAFSDGTLEACLEGWPKQAISMARKALDEFEAQLDKEQA